MTESESTPASTPEAARVPVVAAVVLRDGRYLLGRRPPTKRHGGLWEFPGGKVYPGESRFEAARRELAEELGVGVAGLGPRLHTVQDEGSPFVIEFFDTTIEGSPVACEHDALGWFTVEELRDMALAPADAHFVAQLSGERSARATRTPTPATGVDD